MQHSPIIAKLLAESPEVRREWLRSLTRRELLALKTSPDFWLRPEQHEPNGNDYYLWLLLTGRGWGKTFAASHAVNKWARQRSALGNGVIVIAGATYSDVRLKMVEPPDGGILATSPVNFRPTWSPSTGRGTLRWPNGAQAICVSGSDIDVFRGLNIARLWADEFTSWTDPQGAWERGIVPALRSGPNPRAIITTTPTALSFLKHLTELHRVVVTRGSTFDNPAFGAHFIDQIRRQYVVGSDLYRQEVMGEIVLDDPRALFNQDNIAQWRTHEPPVSVVRIVVGVDPGTAEHNGGNEAGIVVVALLSNGTCLVLYDASTSGEPRLWIPQVVDTYRAFKADCVVVERNNGGQLVELALRAEDPNIPIKTIWSSHGKMTRAEPVSHKYNHGLVRHYGVHALLEQQMSSWWPGCGKPSPDRMDALVFAVAELLNLHAGATESEPDDQSTWQGYA